MLKSKTFTLYISYGNELDEQWQLLLPLIHEGTLRYLDHVPYKKPNALFFRNR